MEEYRKRFEDWWVRIHEIRNDDEAAHGEEIAMRAEILVLIASGTFTRPQMVELAKLALRTDVIEFSRWCA